MGNLSKYPRKLYYWLLWRNKRKYNYKRRANHLFKLIFILAISIIVLVYAYKSFSDLGIWTWLLLVISGIFTIKYGFEFLGELGNWNSRQINLIRVLIVLLLLFLSWQIYQDRQDILDRAIPVYNNLMSQLPIITDSINIALEEFDEITTPDVDVPALELKVHNLINNERTLRGLEPLIWDDRLNIIARAHGQDMIDREFYGHDNPDGEDPTARGIRAGYRCRKDYSSYYTEGLAENIALTPIHSDVIGCGSTYNSDDLADCIVQGWMTSQGHRENILTVEYDRAGLGIAVKGSEVYSTQNFC